MTTSVNGHNANAMPTSPSAGKRPPTSNAAVSSAAKRPANAGRLPAVITDAENNYHDGERPIMSNTARAAYPSPLIDTPTSFYAALSAFLIDFTAELELLPRYPQAIHATMIHIRWTAVPNHSLALGELLEGVNPETLTEDERTLTNLAVKLAVEINRFQLDLTRQLAAWYEYLLDVLAYIGLITLKDDDNG